jgi:hypothetical protein
VVVLEGGVDVVVVEEEQQVEAINRVKQTILIMS